MLGRREFDVLIVDTFPRGLGGELAPWLDRLDVPRVLIHRDLSPSYARWADLPAVAGRYDLIILPGEDAPTGDLAARDAHGPLAGPRPRGTPRPRRGPADSAFPATTGPRSSSSAAGVPRRSKPPGRWRPGSTAISPTGPRSASLRRSTPSSPDEVAIWPLLEVAAGVDVLVGSGGYNTVHEARATATPLVALARPRRYDRQAHRLSHTERARDEEDVLRLVSGHLGRWTAGGRVVPTYENGTHVAVRLIEGLTARGDRRGW